MSYQTERLNAREIGKRLGISHVKVLRLEAQALDKMRAEAERRGLSKDDFRELMSLLVRGEDSSE